MNVCVVFAGNYSSRDAVAAFASRELAVRYAETRGYIDPHEEDADRFDIEEFEIIEALPEPFESLLIRSSITADGEWSHQESTASFFPGLDTDLGGYSAKPIRPDSDIYKSWTSAPTGHDGNYVKDVSFSTSGTDQDRVRKAHSERVAHVIADFAILTADLGDEPEWRRPR